MKIRDFNKQSLLQKQRYIKQFVEGIPFITGVLVFSQYMIYTIYSVNGHLLECEAYALDDLGREEAISLLKGRECVAMDVSDWPDIKKAVSNKLMKVSGMLN